MSLEESANLPPDYNIVSQSESESSTLLKRSIFARLRSRIPSITIIPYILGILISIYTLFTVFEINMQSLRISSDHITPNLTAPAKRVVIFLSDGQRLDTTFTITNRKMPLSPFLRSKAAIEGSYGISHASLPTESKIDITSIISGSYMDLPDLFNIYFKHRAITDNILNTSTYAWSFGNPEIVNMYKDTVSEKDTLTTIPQDYHYNWISVCP